MKSTGYFWNIKELRRELAQGTLTENARFIFLLIYVVTTAIALEFMGPVAEPNAWDNLLRAGSIGIPLLGTVWLYRQNGASRGRRFLERYLSLGWVFLIRFVVFSLPVLLLAFIAAEYLGVLTEDTGPFDATAILLWEVAFFAGLGWHVHLVASQDAA